MRVIDPGHEYELDHLDEQHSRTMSQVGRLKFVKRLGEKYPGNQPPAHPGVTTQEVLRALIDRVEHVSAQDGEYGVHNVSVLSDLRHALWSLEARAARRAGDFDRLNGVLVHRIEEEPTCRTCGHIRCREGH